MTPSMIFILIILVQNIIFQPNVLQYYDCCQITPTCLPIDLMPLGGVTISSIKIDDLLSYFAPEGSSDNKLSPLKEITCPKMDNYLISQKLCGVHTHTELTPCSAFIFL